MHQECAEAKHQVHPIAPVLVGDWERRSKHNVRASNQVLALCLVASCANADVTAAERVRKSAMPLHPRPSAARITDEQQRYSFLCVGASPCKSFVSALTQADV